MNDQQIRREYDKAMQLLDGAGVPRTRAGEQMALADRVHWLIQRRK